MEAYKKWFEIDWNLNANMVAKAESTKGLDTTVEKFCNISIGFDINDKSK